MPYTPLRTTGACGHESLYIISGEGSNDVFHGGPASRQAAVLTMKLSTAQVASLTHDEVLAGGDEVWSWRLLPELPLGAGRWLAAAGVLSNPTNAPTEEWLVLTGGTNTPGIEMATTANPQINPKLLNQDGQHLHDSAASGQSDCTAQSQGVNGWYPRCMLEKTTPCNCPPWQQSYKLRVAHGESFSNYSWQLIAPFPDKLGYDAPNTAVSNGSLYIFGGWRASVAGMRRWQLDDDSLYGTARMLNLPVPLTEGTNGAQLR